MTMGRSKNPSARLSTFIIVGLSLSIGWGIRGNFGHEYGAMIAGALAATSACLLSGREDWRSRVAFFAFFGALGWGFGGSISYMQVISYTHSGHFPSQLYGFAGLFLIGFLWAGMGGAGTALPAVADRERLTELFRPLLFIFAGWWVWAVVGGDLVRAVAGGFDDGAFRHKSPTYWFDSDWLKACVALVSVCVFDLWDRRANRGNPLADWSGVAFVFAVAIQWISGLSPGWLLMAAASYAVAAFALDLINRRRSSFYVLVFLSAAGALAGSIAFALLDKLGAVDALARGLVRYQGDLSLFEWPEESLTPLQRELVDRYDGDAEAFRAELYTNWPPFLAEPGLRRHWGWLLGLLIGAGIYFVRFGRFRSGSRMFLYMGAGWLVGFALFPVLLGWRLTPPRSDDWAGVLGLYVALLVYLVRRGLAPVAYASIVSAAVGGIGFSGAAFLKLVFVRPGNPKVVDDGVAVEAWRHWQDTNWHSVLEQTYGFINGIGIALALALLATRIWPVDSSPRVRRWTEPFSVAFILLFLTFVNWRKAVGTWVSQGAVPESMKMPLFQSVDLSAGTWFGLVYALVATAGVLVLVFHMQRPLAIIPPTWLGRGQLLFLVFLWVCVIFNHERALTGFSQGRLITEGALFMNAALLTALLMACARSGEDQSHVPTLNKTVPLWRAAAMASVVFVVVVLVETAGVRMLYGGAHAGHSGRNGHPQMRFGPDAEWRINPLLKTRRHN